MLKTCVHNVKIKSKDKTPDNATGLQIASRTILSTSRTTRPSCINENEVMYLLYIIYYHMGVFISAMSSARRRAYLHETFEGR